VKFEPEPAGEGEISVMRGALVTGKTAQPFQLAYKGEARPQAEALARNLRRFAMGTGAAGSKPAEPGDETKKPEAPKSEVDE
jgi:hypothetical protein